MRRTPIPTEAQRNAIRHAIHVHRDHYVDVNDEHAVNALDNTLTSLDTDQTIPREAIGYIWDILMEMEHLKIATQSDYNDGIDRSPLLETINILVAFNGDALFNSYSNYRDELAENARIDNQTFDIEGNSIVIPDNVELIDDPEDAPKTNNPDKIGRQPFVMVALYQDMTSAGWYAEVYEDPGATPYASKHAADEADAVQKAIQLSKKHDIPLVNTSWKIHGA